MRAYRDDVVVSANLVCALQDMAAKLATCSQQSSSKDDVCVLQAKGLLDAALVGAVLKLAEPNTRVRDESTNTLIFLAGLPGAAQSTTAFIINVGAPAHALVYSERVRMAIFVCRGGLRVGGAGCFETAEAAGESCGGWHAPL